MTAPPHRLVGPPEGVTIGHATETEAQTGCTVVLCPPGARGSVAVLGGGPGTRETDTLDPRSNASSVTAVVLTGGSAYGLAAADGVARWCEEHGRGYETPAGLIPIVPAAVVYDLPAGDARVRPGPEHGRQACEQAQAGVPERGRVGAGTGTAAGKVLGRDNATPTGVGYAARRVAGTTVAALVVANPLGDVIAADGSVMAGPRAADGSLGRSRELLAAGPPAMPTAPEHGDREHTTLVCVMTDARLSKLGCATIARMAGAGVARAVEPCFSPYDGDVAFCVATGEDLGHDGPTVLTLGTAAADAVAAAVRDAATAAR